MSNEYKKLLDDAGISEKVRKGTRKMRAMMSPMEKKVIYAVADEFQLNDVEIVDMMSAYYAITLKACEEFRITKM